MNLYHVAIQTPHIVKTTCGGFRLHAREDGHSEQHETSAAAAAAAAAAASAAAVGVRGGEVRDSDCEASVQNVSLETMGSDSWEQVLRWTRGRESTCRGLRTSSFRMPCVDRRETQAWPPRSASRSATDTRRGRGRPAPTRPPRPGREIPCGVCELRSWRFEGSGPRP